MLSSPLLVLLVLFACFFISLALGVPVSVGIGLSTLVTGTLLVGFEKISILIAQKLFTGIDSFTLLAIPFFILSGNIMNTGGIATRLISLAKVISGRLPGSLLHTNIVGNMLFGSISGSSIAAAAAIGGVMGPLQKKAGYDDRYSAAVNISSAPCGILIPPSGPLILYSAVAGGTSISALFLAGYLPGILMGLFLMVAAYVISKKFKYPISERLTLRASCMTILDALPSLSLIVIVIGGIILGVFTPTEAAAIAVIYSFFLSFVYRELKLVDVPKLLVSTARTTVMIMFLIGASSGMSWIMTFADIPRAVSDLLLGVSNSKYVVLFLMNIILLIVGTFMDLTPAVLIFTPIFLPIAINLGMHPVHFGIMLIFNLGIGNVTPPVGSVLFVGCSIAKIKIEEIVKPLLPMFIVMVITLMLVTYIPYLSLAIPKMAGLITVIK